MLRNLTYLSRALAVGVAYYVIARLGLDLASVHPSATVISPSAGFAFAAVLVGGCRFVPAIFAVAFFAHALSSGPSYVAAAAAAGDALEAFAGGLLVNRLAGRNVFADPTGVAKLAYIATFAAAIGASAGAILGARVGDGVEISSLVDNVDWGSAAPAAPMAMSAGHGSTLQEYRHGRHKYWQIHKATFVFRQRVRVAPALALRLNRSGSRPLGR